MGWLRGFGGRSRSWEKFSHDCPGRGEHVRLRHETSPSLVSTSHLPPCQRAGNPFGSASPPISHTHPPTRASFLPSPPSLLFPEPPSPHPEVLTYSPVQGPPGQSLPQHIPQYHQSVSPLSQLADARMCHAAFSYSDCSSYPGSSTVTMAYSLPSQGASTLAEPCATGGACQRAMVAPLFCDQ